MLLGAAVGASAVDGRDESHVALSSAVGVRLELGLLRVGVGVLARPLMLLTDQVRGAFEMGLKASLEVLVVGLFFVGGDVEGLVRLFPSDPTFGSPLGWRSALGLEAADRGRSTQAHWSAKCRNARPTALSRLAPSDRARLGHTDRVQRSFARRSDDSLVTREVSLEDAAPRVIPPAQSTSGTPTTRGGRARMSARRPICQACGLAASFTSLRTTNVETEDEKDRPTLGPMNIRTSCLPSSQQRGWAWTGRLRAVWGAGAVALTLALAACDSGGEGGTPPVTHVLNLSVAGGGAVAGASGSIQCGHTCSATLAAGTSVTLTATAAAGSRLASWGGACSGQTATCNFSMDAAKSVTATFEPIPTASFALDVAVAGLGGVSSSPAGIQCGSACRADFASGTSVTLTATPAQGQVLSAWSGACAGQADTCQVNMAAARAVTATFGAAPPPRAWQAAQLLETSNDFNVASTSGLGDIRALTAIDPNGNALVLWSQSDGSPDGNTLKVYSRRYVVGQGWDAAVHVAGLASTANLVTGRLLMDTAGNAVWIRHDFQARRYSPGGGWSNTAITAQGTVFGALADAKIDAAGAVHILRSGDGNVWHATLSAAATQYSSWADVAANETAAHVLSDGVRLALSSNGTAMAVWRERNPGDANDSIWANRRLASGTWQMPVRIEEVLTDAQDRPALGMDDSGNAIAAWRQGSSLYVNRFTASAAAWGTATEFDAGQVTALSGADIDLVMMGDGRAVLTWDSGFNAVKSMTYAPATGFSALVLVNSYNLDRALAIDQQARVVMVYRAVSQWPNPVDAIQHVYTRSMDFGGAWSDAVALETGATTSKGAMVLAMNGAGQAVCVWGQDDLANSTVRNSLWASLLR